MDIKKIEVIACLLFFVILFSGSVFADSCSIQSSCSSANTVVKLSSNSNAHGELYTENNYNRYLCCDFTGTHSCTGSNEVLRLSASTNAHAEGPDVSHSYSTVRRACFGDLECISTIGSCGSDYPIGMVSLSSQNGKNSHIASVGIYSSGRDICCRHACTPEPESTTCGSWECGTRTNNCGEQVSCGSCGSGETCVSGSCQGSGGNPDAFWSKNGQTSIDQLDVVVGETSVFMILVNSGLSNGESINFEIKEDDLIDDDEIRILSGTVDNNEKAVVEWTITQNDLDKTNDYDDFFFRTIHDGDTIATSQNLELTIMTCSGINFCVDYLTQSECEADDCSVAEDSVGSGITCGGNTQCTCAWEDNSCVSKVIESSGPECGDGNAEGDEVCDGTDLDGKNCQDFGCDGGELNCSDSCGFDLSSCTGCPTTPGVCGDGKIDYFDETCDGTNYSIPNAQCWNFDNFEDGTLSCDSTCHYDISDCIVEDYYGAPLFIGTCTYTQNSDDTCEDDGYLTSSMSAEWQWHEENSFNSDLGADYIKGVDNKWHYDPDGESSECIERSTSLPCPTGVQLPFFGFYGTVLTLITISLVYVFLILRKEG